MKSCSSAYLILLIGAVWGDMHQGCIDLDKTFEQREEAANVVMTGTVKNLYRDRDHPPMLKGAVEIKRIIKGSDIINKIPGMSSPFYRRQVTVDGFGDPMICHSDIHKYDTRIFMLNLAQNGELRLNSSLVRITYDNLDRADAAADNIPYKAKPPPVPTAAPCEVKFCAYGAECKVDADNKAYCECPSGCSQDSEVYTPVCGSDNTTYSSECHLRAKSCQEQKRIKVKFPRPCDIKDPCENKKCSFGAECVPSLDGLTAKCQCPENCYSFGDSDDSTPVCGNDGQDYKNKCDMRRSACNKMKEIKVKYYGKCDPCRSTRCEEGKTCQLDENRQPQCTCENNCDGQGFAPVCGNDGRTYSNECTMEVEACRKRKTILVHFRGECDRGHNPCSRKVCVTGQECFINKDGEAMCKCPPPCEMYLRPVCGTDGKTYDNECELKRYACISQKAVSVDFAGVCAEDGPCNSYKCLFHGICVVKDGKPDCDCPSCSSVYDPVCGSDGKTYENECQMNAASCAQQKNINIRFRGPCENKCNHLRCDFYSVCQVDEKTNKPACVCPTQCQPVDEKVCGTDGVTYMNECQLRVASCQKKQFIMIASRGSCDMCANIKCPHGARCEDGQCVCPTTCPTIDDKVCGTDMVTYMNECELKKEACVSSKDIEVEHAGECTDGISGDGSGSSICDESTCRKYGGVCDLDAEGNHKCSCDINCPAIRSKVCGSDGKVYVNQCEMTKASCEQQKEIQPVLMENCNDDGMEEFCDGQPPVKDLRNNKEYDCTDNKAACPQGSYCHEIGGMGRCCKGDTPVRSCRDTTYGCCPDGAYTARGYGYAGCPSVCRCNSLGSLSRTCDPVSSQCNCKPGVGGRRCDRCEPGYWGLQLISTRGNSGCIPCGCNPVGSVRDDCEQMDGTCVCARGYTGSKCYQCESGRPPAPGGSCFTSHSGDDGLQMLRDEGIKYLLPNDADKATSCDQVKCKYGGQCEMRGGLAVCRCPKTCPSDKPEESVCGTNGLTYGSECQLRQFACRQQIDVRLHRKGPCDEKDTSTPASLRSRKTTRHINKNKDGSSTPTYGKIADLCVGDEDCTVEMSFCQAGLCACRGGYAASKDKLTCTATPDSSGLCEPNPCLAGGSCYVSGSQFKCLCPLGKGGPRCEQASTLPMSLPPEITTQPLPPVSSNVPSTDILATDAISYNSLFSGRLTHDEMKFTVPSFEGKSYLVLKRLRHVNQNTTIEIKFATYNNDGILLYCGQAEEGKGDFISLAIVEGHIEFRYDLGNGVAKLKTEEMVTLNRFHKVVATRNGQEGTLQLDDGKEVKVKSPGTLTSLNLGTPVYLGYVPAGSENGYSSESVLRVFTDIGSKIGLVGCLDSLRIEGTSYDHEYDLMYPFSQDIDDGWGIGECGESPCATLPCHNAGTCLKVDMKQFKCQCKQGFTGPQCQIDLSKPCESKPCQAGGICEQPEQGTFNCKCIAGRMGLYCEKDAAELNSITVPQFKGNSYIQLPLESKISGSLYFELWFLATESNGVLLYGGQNDNGEGDFISLNLINGYLQFRFDLGSGMANITSRNTVSLNRWHKVEVSRTNRLGLLAIDNEMAVEGESGGSLKELNLQDYVFIGGFRGTPSPSSGVTTGLSGAIQRVYEDKQLRDDLLSGAKDFNHITQFHGPPCMGPNRPCHNGGSCIPMLNDYACICTKEFTGKKCKRKISAVDVTKPLKFTGDNYLKYMNQGDEKEKSQKMNKFEIQLKTTAEEGLILLQQKAATVQGDYQAIALRDGYIEVSYNLGKQGLSNLHFITSDQRVNDGSWHTVTFIREKRKGILQIDGHKAVIKVSAQGATQLDTDGYLWIGGKASPPEGLNSAYKKPFRGCIRSIKVDNMDLNLASYASINGMLQFCD